MTVTNPQNAPTHEIARAKLDPGEASAIALALEIQDCLLILDDYDARRFALGCGLRITGTLGILLRAKRSGLISTVQPYLSQIITAGLWVSDRLIEQTLRDAGEYDA